MSRDPYERRKCCAGHCINPSGECPWIRGCDPDSMEMVIYKFPGETVEKFKESIAVTLGAILKNKEKGFYNG